MCFNPLRTSSCLSVLAAYAENGSYSAYPRQCLSIVGGSGCRVIPGKIPLCHSMFPRHRVLDLSIDILCYLSMDTRCTSPYHVCKIQDTHQGCHLTLE